MASRVDNREDKRDLLSTLDGMKVANLAGVNVPALLDTNTYM